jgi:uncharacterized protein YbjT (DUF2867 family)
MSLEHNVFLLSIFVPLFKRSSMTVTPTVIVFGATGDVGSAVAFRARQLGARVVLATRTLTKPVPGLDTTQYNGTGYRRVVADLTQPQSVYDAVVGAGASRAFIYMAYGTSDHMRSSIQAMKSAGIDLIVVLSSHGVQGEVRAIPRNSYIPWSNAQVEIVLEETMGPRGFIALRPAYFASNALWWKSMVREGIVKTAYPDLAFDWVSPRDVGNVGGQLLVQPSAALTKKQGINFVYVCGPVLLTQQEAIQTIGQALGLQIKVEPISKEEHVQAIKAGGEPEEVARSSVEMMSSRDQQGLLDPTYSAPFYEDVKENVEKYTQVQASTFADWLAENRMRFLA